MLAFYHVLAVVQVLLEKFQVAAYMGDVCLLELAFSSISSVNDI